MRILHVIDSGGLYGAEVMLLHLMTAQRALGLVPILASIGEIGIADKMVEVEARKRGLTVEPFRMRAGFNLAGAIRVLAWAREQGVQVIHSHGYKGNILLGILPRRLRRLPQVATVHGWTWTNGMSRMMVYEWLDALCLRRVDAVVVVNRAMLTHPRLQIIARHRLHVINNGIPLSGETSQSSGPLLQQDILDFAGKGTCIVTLGRLSEEKGFAFLIRAAGELVTAGRDVRLVIFGEGPLRYELEQLVARLGLSARVMLPGFVADGAQFLSHCTIFALPSLTEGLPMVLLEAMEAGLPIVAANVGGIPEVLDHGQCGLLVPAGEVAALRDGLLAIVENREQARVRVQRARERVRTQYSSRVMAQHYLTVYQEAMDGFQGVSPP